MVTNIHELSKRMEDKLKTVGLPFETLHVIGTTICITTKGLETSDKWVNLLHPRVAQFIKRNEDYEHNKVNTNTCLLPSSHKVYKVFFDISKGKG